MPQRDVRVPQRDVRIPQRDVGRTSRQLSACIRYSFSPGYCENVCRSDHTLSFTPRQQLHTINKARAHRSRRLGDRPPCWRFLRRDAPGCSRRCRPGRPGSQTRCRGACRRRCTGRPSPAPSSSRGSRTRLAGGDSDSDKGVRGDISQRGGRIEIRAHVAFPAYDAAWQGKLCRNLTVVYAMA